MAYTQIGTVQAGAQRAHLEKVHGVFERTVTLTQAQLRALHNASVEIAPSPGPGKAIVPLSMVTERAAGTAYTAGSNIQVRYGTNTGVVPISATAGDVAPAAAGIRHTGRVDGPIHEDQSIELRASAALGNGTGTLRVTVQYVVLKV